MAHKEKRYPVMELFGPTIQGEGIMTGTLTHFIRFGGCGLQCTWCDSLFSVIPSEIRKHRTMMTIETILQQIHALPYAPYITFTGGDPCLHKGFEPIIRNLNMHHIRVAVETQGQLFPDWLKECDVITFSPKPPSSGNVVDPNDLHEWLIRQGARTPFKRCIKIVVFSEEDFEYAMKVYSLIPSMLYDAFYFTAGTPMFLDNPLPEEASGEEIGMRALAKRDGILGNMESLAELMLRDRPIPFNEKVHLGGQVHALLWPDKDKGV